jgi:hypothetical protein
MKGEIWTDEARQPFGTTHSTTQINLAERTIVYAYKVRWYCLPWYWIKMMMGTIKEGFTIQVIATPKTVIDQLFDEEIH